MRSLTALQDSSPSERENIIAAVDLHRAAFKGIAIALMTSAAAQDHASDLGAALSLLADSLENVTEDTETRAISTN